MTDQPAREGDSYTPLPSTDAPAADAGRTAPSTPPTTALYDADDEAQDGPITAPDTLRDLIVAQGMQETGIFVLLFTSETAAPPADLDPAAVSASADVVERKAAELGVDLDRLTLYDDDAYLLQAALGETLAPEPA